MHSCRMWIKGKNEVDEEDGREKDENKFTLNTKSLEIYASLTRALQCGL